MKTHRARILEARRPYRGWPLAVLLAVGWSVFPLRADEPAGPPKDHALFVGGDACIRVHGAEHSVVGVTGGSVAVLVDGAPVLVPLAEVESVRVTRNLKLSDLIAQVGDFEAMPIHQSLSADPKFGSRWIAMNGMRENAIMRQNVALNAQAYYSALKNTVRGGGIGEAKMGSANSALASSSQAVMAADSSLSSIGRPEEEGKSKEVNALEVSFSITAPRTARDGFLLLATGFREKEGAELQYRIHLEPLNELGPKPQRVSFVQAGFPEAYVLEGTGVYLFAEGREIASNLSEKRVDITAADAMRYLTLSFVTQHAKETLAAAPFQIILPADFHQRLQPDWLQKPVYLTVATDGAVKQAAADAAGAALDPYLASVVSKFWFTPALKEGKPVESVVAFSLSDYVR